ncbi:MAG: hypothetical protein ACK5LK_09500, partial [Chthoniobacterales bacterium]
LFGVSLATLKAASVKEITAGGVTWKFKKAHESGSFVNGDPWIVGPVEIISISNDLNDSSYTPREDQNGSMINPGTNAKQGYDGSFALTYDPDLNVGRPGGEPISEKNPLVVDTDSTLVSAVSWLYNSKDDKEPGCPRFDAARKTPRPVLRSVGILTVLSKVPPKDAFRPPYVGSDKSIKYQASQIDYSKIPKLNAPGNGGEPSMEMLAKSFSRTWLDHVNGWVGDYFHPSENMRNYGRDMGRLVGDGTLALFIDPSPQGANPEKDTLVIGLLQYGLDSTGIADNGGDWHADGGIGLGRKWPILFAGALLNDKHMLDVGNWTTRFQENEQHFYVTEEEVEITNGPTWAPDKRTPSEPYKTEDIGKADWGIRHAYRPVSDNAYIGSNYRGINASITPAFALAALQMGLKDQWNYPAFFDYNDRIMKVWQEDPKAIDPYNVPTPFLMNMWSEYRDKIE